MGQKFYHQKLIRDRIPEIIMENGGKYKTRILGNIEYKEELKKKIVEESKELIKTPKEKLLNELADVLELVKSISSHYKIPFSKVEAYQENKRKTHGGFKKKIFLIWSDKKAG